jgi:hypothetical protein
MRKDGATTNTANTASAHQCIKTANNGSTAANVNQSQVN